MSKDNQKEEERKSRKSKKRRDESRKSRRKSNRKNEEDGEIEESRKHSHRSKRHRRDKKHRSRSSRKRKIETEQEPKPEEYNIHPSTKNSFREKKRVTFADQQSQRNISSINPDYPSEIPLRNDSRRKINFEEMSNFVNNEDKMIVDSLRSYQPRFSNKPNFMDERGDYEDLRSSLNNLRNSLGINEEKKKLDYVVQTKVLPAKERILQTIAEVNEEVNKVKRKRDLILEEANQFMDQIKNRLNIEYQKNTKTLSDNLRQLNFSLNRTNNFIEKATKPTVLDNHVELISQSHSLSNEITNSLIESQNSTRKNRNEDIKFTNEIANLKLMIKEFNKNKRIVSEKDDIIRTLINEKEKIQKLREIEVRQLSELYLQTKKELYKWIKFGESKVSGGKDDSILKEENISSIL